nr:hypothetical protein [Tanacetum cinerariifolium]
MDGTREIGVISPTDLPILVLSSLGVPLRATLIQFALLVDVDTKESVVELQVLASSVGKLAIYRRIVGRTPLQAHLVRLIRSQVLRVVFLPSLRVRLLIPQRSGDRHQPTSQQSSHRSHGQNNDRHGSDRRGGSDNHRSSNNNNNSSGSNNRNSDNGRDQRNRGH